MSLHPVGKVTVRPLRFILCCFPIRCNFSMIRWPFCLKVYQRYGRTNFVKAFHANSRVFKNPR